MMFDLMLLHEQNLKGGADNGVSGTDELMVHLMLFSFWMQNLSEFDFGVPGT